MRILIAEDSGPSRLALERTLARWGYEVISCTDGTAAWHELNTEAPPRMAILDWMMPGLSGPEICRMVRDKKDEQYTYILLLTSKSQKEDLIEGMESGADDYVTKPFDLSELQVRIRAGKRILDLQSELLEAREALRHQAMHDPLTGLWNRRSILEILGREQARAVRQNHTVGLLMLDLDHFKAVNDTYGHLAGDEVLREVARRLGVNVRTYDGVGRYGGEEFLVVLSGCDEKSVIARAEAMRYAICCRPVDYNGQNLNITASFGCTVFDPALPQSSAELIRIADDAMYDAKRKGRNRVFCSGVTLPDPVPLADPVGLTEPVSQ